MMKDEKIISRLDEVALGSLDKASFKALLRLQVYFTGRTHELMLDFGKEARGILMDYSGLDGNLDSSRGFQAQTKLLKLWGDTFGQWRDEFLSARREAVSLPFGVLAIRHERLITTKVTKVHEGNQVFRISLSFVTLCRLCSKGF